MKELLKKKKNLIVVLFISVSILLFTTNYVKATEDTNEENTLPDEVNGKIVLNADVNLAETFNIEEGKELTIDLNGHNLIGNIECIIENRGNLTIKDSAETKGKIDLKTGGTILKNSSGNLTIDGITISAVGKIIKNQADSTLMVKNSKLESKGNDSGTEILANWGNATVQNSIIKSTGNIKAIGSHSEIIEEEEKNSELNLINTQIEAGTLFNARRKADKGSTNKTTTQTIIINGGSVVQKSINTFSINNGGTEFICCGEINVNDNYLNELFKDKFKHVSGGAKISVIRGTNTIELGDNTKIISNVELIIPEGTKINGDITNNGILRLNDEFDGTVTNYGELIQNYEDEKIKIKTSEEGKENITIPQLMQLQAVDGESGTYLLKYKPADYTEVDRAIANAMDTIEKYETIISDGIEELRNAIDAVDDDKDIRDQDKVDAMAETIKQAINNLVYYDADYTDVNKAKQNAILEIDKKEENENYTYTEESRNSVKNQIDEIIVYGKDKRYQEDVDTMSSLIESALENLRYNLADYTDVDRVIAQANNILETYGNCIDEESGTKLALENAITNVDRNIDFRHQDEVDTIANTIKQAIANLVYKPANYTDVYTARDEAEVEINRKTNKGKNIYTEESRKNVSNQINRLIVYGKDKRYQEDVNTMAKNVNNALSNLVKNNADYTNVNNAKSKAVKLDKTKYTSETWKKLENALNSIKTGLKITEQTQVDAMATAIENAIKGLVEVKSNTLNIVPNVNLVGSSGKTTNKNNSTTKTQNTTKSGTYSGVVKTDNKNTINNYKAIPSKVSVAKPSIDGKYTYTGKKQTVKLKNFDSNVMKITNNTRTESGKQNVTIELKDKQNYQWSDETTNNVILSWNISQKDISKATVYNILDKVYTGRQIKQSIVVKDGKNTLKNGTDYTVSYKNNVNTGKAIVTITGKGNYSGTITKSFIITATKVKNIKVKSQKENEITLSWKKNAGKVTGYKIFVYNEDKKAYDYVGKTSKTTCTIKKLKAGTKYIFKIRAYTVVDNKQYNGKASQILKTATKTKPTKIKAITTKNNNVTLKWDIISEATGYDVYMSTEKNGKYTKISRINNSKIVKYTTDSNLKTGKTYYFKVRTYKKVNGKKIYSAYSKKAKIKVK